MRIKNLGGSFFGKIKKSVGWLGLIALVVIVAMKFKTEIKAGLKTAVGAVSPDVATKVDEFIA
ncbi:MAG: hypothetical protein ACYDEX_21950 [Mobilitalea sp.]